MPDYKFLIHITHKEVIGVTAESEARARELLESLTDFHDRGQIRKGELINSVEQNVAALNVTIIRRLYD